MRLFLTSFVDEFEKVAVGGKALERTYRALLSMKPNELKALKWRRSITEWPAVNSLMSKIEHFHEQPFIPMFQPRKIREAIRKSPIFKPEVVGEAKPLQQLREEGLLENRLLGLQSPGLAKARSAYAKVECDLPRDPVRKLEKFSTKLINFPEHEHEAIKHGLARRGVVYTTRIESERGKYRPGEMVVTPWGDTLRVAEVKAHGSIKSHPFVGQLTESEKRTIGTQPFDHVKLEKTAARIKPINYRPVESSNLASVGYDAKRKVLDVKFLGSGTYRYSNVPPKVYRNLLRAKSKGKAFHRLVRKADFDYEKLSSELLLERVREGGIMPSHVHALAKKKGVGFEDLEELMVKLTGKRELEAMNDQELGRVAGQLERL